jgi:hypothetical protein
MTTTFYSILINPALMRYTYDGAYEVMSGWRRVDWSQQDAVKRGYTYEPFPSRI